MTSRPASLKQGRDLLAPFLSDGLVDYGELARSLDFHALREEIASCDLAAASRDEQLAFYINAYNLLVLAQVVARLRREPDWPGVVSLTDRLRFFVLARFKVAGRKLSLMSLENRVIRRFGEPRIHFALNCASSSCPWLPERLFAAESLDDDLERLTQRFLDSDAVDYHGESNTLHLSRIFRWYRGDFRPSVIEFVRRYRDVPADAQLAFQPYDWSLNRQ